MKSLCRRSAAKTLVMRHKSVTNETIMSVD